jgi:hypothetical protein
MRSAVEEATPIPIGTVVSAGETKLGAKRQEGVFQFHEAWLVEAVA